MKQNKAVVIFSGGQDSTTCLYWALKRYDVVEAITFNYGQKHSIELDCAKAICEKENVKQTIIDISFLNTIVESALTSNGDVNEINKYGLPASFVPNRNQLFITLAHAYAQKIGALYLVTGVCETDYSGYFDCRQEFINQIETTCNIGSFGSQPSAEWIAGFIEGEGWFSRQSYDTKEGKKYYPVFGVEQTDKGVLVLMREFFGTGSIRKNNMEKRSPLSRLQSWTLKISGEDCRLVYNLMKTRIVTLRRKEQFGKWEAEHKKYFEGDNQQISKSNLGDKWIKIHTPLMRLNKAETFALAKTENCLQEVIEMSHTCYNGDHSNKHDWGYGCGTCPACTLRREGYEKAIKEGLI